MPSMKIMESDRDRESRRLWQRRFFCCPPLACFVRVSRAQSKIPKRSAKEERRKARKYSCIRSPKPSESFARSPLCAGPKIVSFVRAVCTLVCYISAKCMLRRIYCRQDRKKPSEMTRTRRTNREQKSHCVCVLFIHLMFFDLLLSVKSVLSIRLVWLCVRAYILLLTAIFPQHFSRSY